MLIILTSAKTMTGTSKIKAPAGTMPRFAQEANEIALNMAQFSTDDLKKILKLNPKLALENYNRFQEFHTAEVHSLQALLAYTGVVFKNINPKDFTEDDFLYANDHLRVASICYGLLRPLDLIKPYRMEYEVKLPELGEGNMYNYWRPRQTELLIDEVKKSDNILINLASQEIQGAYDWKKVGSTVRIITPEFKKPGSKIVVFRIEKDQYDLPDYAGIMDQYEKLHKDMQDGKVVSAYALDRHGIAAAVAKMAFGNGMGVKIEHNLDPRDFFAPGFGDIILEVPDGKVGELSITYTVIGEVTADGNFSYGNTVITVDEAENAWKGTLEKVFKTVSSENDKEAADRDEKLYRADSIYVCKNKVAKPRVFIPVFPGTNCEYDSTRAFERAGAEVDVKVFKNLTAEDIHDSVELFEKAIDQAQIIMFPGGFSAGDEPDGSAKFFATAFQNAKIKEAVTKLLNERDGLALGICNGFQALIKLGLVPYGEILGQTEDSPTLTFNTIGRHISKMVYTKVVTNKSPWLAGAKLGGVYTNPASHGEGRFVASKEWIDKLMANGQIATRYCDVNGNLTNDEYWNVNGSYCGIEGITSPDGRVFGKMAHAERRDNGVAVNIYGEQDLKIFESGVAYFK